MRIKSLKMYCRACMQVNCEEVVNLKYSDLPDGKTLFDYFNECTHLQAEPKDELPQILCTRCTKHLYDAYNFIKKAHQTNTELLKILVVQKSEQEFLCSTTEEKTHIVEFARDPLAVPDPPTVVSKISATECCRELDVSLSDIKVELDIPEEFENIGEHHKQDEVRLHETEENYVPEISLQRDIDESVPILKDDQESSIQENRNMESSIQVEENENDSIEGDDSDYTLSSEEEEENCNDLSRARRLQNVTCSLCDFKCKSQGELKDHIFELHKYNILCMNCPKVYEFPDELRIHEYLVHGTGSPIECEWCKQSLPRDDLIKHFQKRHSNAYAKYFPRMRVRGTKEDDTSHFRCEYCQKSFSSILELADHTKGCKFDCPLCLKTFKKAGSYRAHTKRIHNRTVSSLKDSSDGTEIKDKPFKCSLCPRQYQRKSILRGHMKSKHDQNLDDFDDDTKLYACEYCDKRFKNRTSVYCHKSRKHRNMMSEKSGDRDNSTINGNEEIESEYPDFVKCKYCNREVEGSKIQYHEKRHIYAMNRKRNFLCSFCPREFNSEVTVKSHEKKVHLGKKPEPKQCPICEKKFDPEYLRNHIRNVHTSERKFICDVCGDPFKSYILLHSHKRLHFERNFPCTVCEKKFIRSFDLKVHMRMHTGEEPYACHICDRRFKMKVRLNYHLQRHAGIKRKCNVCGKEFNHVKQLKIHSYKHTGMPYRCSVCDYGCAQRDVFRKHLLRMHDMTMTPDEYCAMFKANTGRFPHVKTLEELQSAVEQE
ncbi:zinc finger protein 700 [Ceratitis capitata]|nr:zinc finger protein 700 [Ceratitis capitata]